MADAQTTVTLDEFLVSLGGGTVHSSGAFTISEEAARDKLARYTLIHPSLYVLELMAVAVLGKATRFEVTTPGGSTHFRFDGTPPTAEDCQRAMGQMFESSSSRRLGCLGLGLSAAHSVAGQDLNLILPEGTFAFDGQSLKPAGPPGAAGFTEIQVPGRYGFVGGLFRRDASLAETLGLCENAPLKLRLDDRDLGGGWKPANYWSAGAILHWEHPDYPLRWGSGRVKPYTSAPSPGDFSAMITLMPSEHAAKNGLTIVHQGVSYRTHDPSFAIPGVCAVVMSNGLERNLSRSEILWNDTYQALVESLRIGVELLFEACMDSPYRLCSAFRRCQPTVQWMFDLQRQRDGAEQQQASSWLATEARLRTYPTPEALVDLATEQAGLGKARKSEDFTLAAIELLIEKFRQSGRSRDLAKNLEAWTPLLRELIGKVAEPTRQAALQEFLTLVEPLKAVENPTPGQQISHYRMRGQPEKAAELLKDWTERPHELSHRVPTEVLLAVSRTEEALDQHLRYLFAADVDAALDQQWPYYKVRDLDLLADILEYRDDPRALTARQLCLANVDGVEMRYLTSLELCRHTRARGKLGLWVKYRALASLLSLNSLMFTVAALEKEAPLVKAILEGRAAIPHDLDEFLLPACDQLGAYTEFFPYLVGRLAHRLRLDGELVKADQLVARCYTLRCMDQSLYGL